MVTEPDDEATGMIGDPIPEVFSPEDPLARFVVAMSMANNDINRAFRDLLRSADEDTPDFAYRVRVLIGYLVEAIDALQFLYRESPRCCETPQEPTDRRAAKAEDRAWHPPEGWT